jgi:hypothetical protein
MIIYTESNWFLDLVYQQVHFPAAQDLIVLHEQGHICLVLPSVCLTETAKSLEYRKLSYLNRLSLHLEETIHEFANVDLASVTIQRRALELTRRLTDRVRDELDRRFDDWTQRIFDAHVEMIPLTAAIVAQARQFQGQFNLERADARILASVLAHAPTQADPERLFLNRDRHFDTDEIRAELWAAGVELVIDPDNLVTHRIRGRLRI